MILNTNTLSAILDPDPKASVHNVNPSSQHCNQTKVLPCSCHRSSQLAPIYRCVAPTRSTTVPCIVSSWYTGTVAPWHRSIVEAPCSTIVPCSHASRWSVYRLSLLNNFQFCHQFNHSIPTNSDISPCSEIVPYLFASRLSVDLCSVSRLSQLNNL